MESHEMKQTDKPTPDLSDEGLQEMAASMYGRMVTYKDEYLVGLLRAVRGQARAAALEEAIALCHRGDGAYERWVQTVVAKLRHAAEEGG
jgi:hypothetical protein